MKARILSVLALVVLAACPGNDETPEPSQTEPGATVAPAPATDPATDPAMTPATPAPTGDSVIGAPAGTDTMPAGADAGAATAPAAGATTQP